MFIFAAMYAVQPLLPVFTTEFNIPVAYASMSLSMTTVGLIIGLVVLGFFWIEVVVVSTSNYHLSVQSYRYY